eukprot:sb/3472079/
MLCHINVTRHKSYVGHVMIGFPPKSIEQCPGFHVITRRAHQARSFCAKMTPSHPTKRVIAPFQTPTLFEEQSSTNISLTHHSYRGGSNLFFCIFLYGPYTKMPKIPVFFQTKNTKKYKKIQKNHEILNIKSTILKTELKTQRCFIGCNLQTNALLLLMVHIIITLGNIITFS